MDYINILPAKNSRKLDKLFMLVFFVVLVIAITLVLFYLYKQTAITKNKVDVVKDVSYTDVLNQEDLSLIHESAPYIYTNYLPQAIVGVPYKAEVDAAVYKLNIQITGELISELPPGLKFTCSTEYNGQPFPTGTTNSLCKCIIEGVPEENGKFAINVSFSIPEGISNAYKSYSLVVNP